MNKKISNHIDYMKLALAEARLALKRREFPVGCVIADENGLICTGSRKKSCENNELEHAEILALRRLYNDYPDRLGGNLVAYSTMEPCLMCYSTLVLNNVRTIVFGYEDVMGGGTNLDLLTLRPLYAEMEVKVIPHILRQECLTLFQTFFQDEANDYLKDSLLAQYTLRQKTQS